MRKLLHANFLRLKKDKYFWTGIVVMALYAIADCAGQYNNMTRYEMTVSYDGVFFASHMVIGMLIAAFCSLYIGTEYSDGTIRNKLIAGCDRKSIYLSNFITCTAAGGMMNTVYMLVAGILGIPLFGFFESSMGAVLMNLLNSVLMTAAFTAVFTMLSMLNQNKALVAVISMIGVFAAIILALYIAMKLGEKEFVDGAVMSKTVGDTTTQTIQKIPNPMYLKPAQRAAHQFVLDLLPTGQSLQIASLSVRNPWTLGAYSLIITGVVNIVGVFCFKRKDLK